MRVIAVTVFFCLTTSFSAAAVGIPGIDLTPHRAVYDLSLEWASGQSGIEGLDGRFVYSFTGGACAGYVTDMRMLTDIKHEDRELVTDQSSSSYENVATGSFDFSSKLYSDYVLQSETSGEALRLADSTVSLNLRGDDGGTFELQDAEFPTEYLANVIQAAENGRHIYEALSYDGSGEKAMRAITLIGTRDEAGKNEDTGWPVTTAYFDIGANEGDEIPAYTVSMFLTSGGVSSHLLMDFGDFKMSGKLKKLDLLDATPCGEAPSTASSSQ